TSSLRGERRARPGARPWAPARPRGPVPGARRPEGAPHGLEPGAPVQGGATLARHPRPELCLLRAQLPRRARAGRELPRDRLRRPGLRRGRAREPVRLPVPPGEEPGGRPRAPRQLRQVMILIPAIDLMDGKAVRLRAGRRDDVTVYSDAPSELAAR